MVAVVMQLMPKTYPSLIDVYTQSVRIDPRTNETIREWNYLDPETVRCNVVALKPKETLEIFGKLYENKKFIKIETATKFDLSQQAGNIRSRRSAPYFQPYDDPYVFNISNVNTQIDQLGNIVCFELYLEYFRTMSEIAR
ncbi:hypothetical protein [Rhodococcus sp. IEGM 1379]|uniref:hypothetical protein n=1 Tax=Rhodococcus sp. IEGM 1379 TaxID=3047086 RepID=UPI0024B64CA3|nr:hypothetical protein [Rhodococcus sp. IEGM 1379]MDI9915497.1 hypothetical protein [Rhodococcus sp. IEGM 1379]